MDEIPQEISGELRSGVLAGLLRVHSKHLEGTDLTACLREAYDVYAKALQRAEWPLTSTLLTELIPGWVHQFAVSRKWLPYPPLRFVKGRGNFLEGWMIRSRYASVPASELTVEFGCLKVTHAYKVEVLKRLAGRIAYWHTVPQTPALLLLDKKAERIASRDAYRNECEAAGIKVTNEMIGEKAYPKSKNPGAKFKKWLECHPSMDGLNDRLVRNVLEEKPHLRKRNQAPAVG
jgi:hypothetical protein